MNLFLHLKIIEDKLQFSNNLNIKGASYTDVDNFSSAEVVAVTLQAITRTERLFVYIDISSEVDLGAMLKVLKALFQFDKQLTVCHSGQHQQATRLLANLKSHGLTKEEVLPKAAHFFS